MNPQRNREYQGREGQRKSGAGGPEVTAVTTGRNKAQNHHSPTCATASGTALLPTLPLQIQLVTRTLHSHPHPSPSIKGVLLACSHPSPPALCKFWGCASPHLGVLGWGGGRRLHIRPTHHNADSSPDAQSPGCHPPGNTRPQGP